MPGVENSEQIGNVSEIAHCTWKMLPHYFVILKRSFSRMNHIGHLQLQLKKLSRH